MTTTASRRLPTATPREEERAARRQARAVARAGEAKALADAKRRRERWGAVMAAKRKERCRCEIRQGMAHGELVELNLAGRQPERRNCTGDRYICPVLVKALELTRPAPGRST